jgi:cell shape-determining protein MreC
MAIDDTIVTTGWSSPRLSTHYPRGIRIGRVTSFGRTDTDLYTQVQVTPFADLSSLEAVLVLIPVDRMARAR